MEDAKPYKVTQNSRKLVAFVMSHVDSWRNHRMQNYDTHWEEYERLWKGKWAANDKTRESERSQLISPATQQAIEARQAEMEEAVFSKGQFFDIEDDILDKDPVDVELTKRLLDEDFKLTKVRKVLKDVVTNGEVYGTGICELIVDEAAIQKPGRQQTAVSGIEMVGMYEGTRTVVKPISVAPKNFVIDPNSDNIDDALGVGVEQFTSIHRVIKLIENGTYRKCDIGIAANESNKEASQLDSYFSEHKALVLRYYGLVPRELLEKVDTEAPVEQQTDDGQAVIDYYEEYGDLVEAVIVIGNGEHLLKAAKNSFMGGFRPVVAYQADNVPGRFWGRGTAEKAYNMQKATDGQLRAHQDMTALTAVPMAAFDATKLPRGFKFKVQPGGQVLFNGSPKDAYEPFQLGVLTDINLRSAEAYQNMLLMATGTADSAALARGIDPNQAQQGGDASLATIIKKNKRSLVNFQEDLLIPFIQRCAMLYMQFNPERYKAKDYTFVPAATLGILAREYEQQQLMSVAATLGPESPVVPLILSGVLENSSIGNRTEILEAMKKLSQPNPDVEKMQMEKAQLEIELLKAQVAELQGDAKKATAEADAVPVKLRIEAAKVSKDGQSDPAAVEFERLVKLKELELKEKEVRIKDKQIDAQVFTAKEQMKHASEEGTKGREHEVEKEAIKSPGLVNKLASVEQNQKEIKDLLAAEQVVIRDKVTGKVTGAKRVLNKGKN